MKRINVTLPEETVRLMDRVASKGQRSRLVDQAVRWYVEGLGRARLRQELEAGAQDRADRDLGLVAEWFNLDEEAWPSNAK
jgi:CopG family transcriptional regulator / antitoxin EndoAI